MQYRKIGIACPFLIKRIMGIEHIGKPIKALFNDCQMARIWSPGGSINFLFMKFYVYFGAIWSPKHGFVILYA
jgi:hypothetical protein